MIVTFYSYKGGTGRTMALANIAVLLARAGRRVLMVDFDLEAPGIWRYFADLHRGLDQRPGLMDMLADHVDGGPDDWRDYVTQVPISGRKIDLITSGRQDPGYPARVLGFDWPGFFEHHDGGEFIERLRDDWQDRYDFVLVDSRTGITDIGGICTIALPDLIVPVFVANAQNIDGIVDVIHRAQRGRQDLAYDRPPAMVLPVLSRFDNRTELEFANEWLSIAVNRLGEFYADWLPSGVEARAMLERTKLPYVAYFGFGEKLAVLLQGVSDPDSLGYALNNIALLIDGHLADLSKVIPERAETSRSATATPRSFAPRDDSWIASVHVEGAVYGAAFAIDRYRLLTSASVGRLIDPAGDAQVTFPKSATPGRYRVASIAKATDLERFDVAVIHLDDPLPREISPAPLSFLPPADLVGTTWWTFGFPREAPVGGTAKGTINGTLSYGVLELDPNSRAGLTHGFAGAPLWSSEHQAVVGLIFAIGKQGQGYALPLDRADAALPDERLRLLGDSLTGTAALGPRQREELLEILPRVAGARGAAERILRRIGFPADRTPVYEGFSSPALFWQHILTELELGILPGGIGVLVDALYHLYPSNRGLAEIASSLRSTGA
jgi:cellulose biosynthesis protein BcsQ